MWKSQDHNVKELFNYQHFFQFHSVKQDHRSHQIQTLAVLKNPKASRKFSMKTSFKTNRKTYQQNKINGIATKSKSHGKLKWRG